MDVQDSDTQLELDLRTTDQVDVEAKLEGEQAKILRSVASAKLDTLQERVAWILNHHPRARDSDITLQLTYWKLFESHIYNGSFVESEDLYRLTRLTSLQRARAKIQNTYRLFRASPEIRRQRGMLEESEKEKAVEQQPSYDVFAVYADESGKTQDYLVVGSVWFLHGPETATMAQEIEECRKRRNFDGELHFKKVSRSNLPVYKEIADILAARSSTVSFKAISVERKGIARVSDALIDLYYLLLLNGVEQEHETARGSLPRMLQLWKDAEEPGSDKLLLENVRDRITQASKSRFNDELKVDHFEAVDSEALSLVQLADLVTSSVGRVLNARGDKNAPKDEFARYLLKVIGMPGGPSEEKVTSDMPYHISL
jgi:hypothetical protein